MVTRAGRATPLGTACTQRGPATAHTGLSWAWKSRGLWGTLAAPHCGVGWGTWICGLGACVSTHGVFGGSPGTGSWLPILTGMVSGTVRTPGLGRDTARAPFCVVCPGGAQRDDARLSLAEPSFVFADVMRERPDGVDSGDDRVYFFFTEVSVEYEFVFKLMVPRVARVCKVSQPPTPGGSGPGRLRVWRMRCMAQAPSFPQNVTLPAASSFCAADGCGGRQTPGLPGGSLGGGSPCRPREHQRAVCDQLSGLSRPASDTLSPDLPGYRKFLFTV